MSMRSSLPGITVAVVIAMLAGAPWADAREPDEALEMFGRLAGKTWTGGYVEGDGVGLVFTDTWTSALGGMAIQRRREVPERSFASEFVFYWDAERRSVAFLGLNNKGDVSTGTVSKEGSLIVIKGRSVRASGDVEFKTTLEILPDGRLRDYWYSLQGGEWVRGHHQEFTARESGHGGS